MNKSFLVLIALAFLAACSAPAAVPATQTSLPTVSVPPFVSSPTATEAARVTDTPAAGSTADTRLPPEQWQAWPVVPQTISAATIAIYRHGQELGNNPRTFSKIGDCESITDYFLVPFDGKPSDYSLGSYANLQGVIDNFHGSFGRTSLAAGKGWTAASELIPPLVPNSKYCRASESPLACEIRVNRPSFALIMLGTNDVYHLDTFEPNMRKILDTLIEAGVVPILATKADNLEKNNAINATLARLAYEYDIPLWNFWLAVQPLPGQGLQPDGSHLSYAQPFFDDPVRMRSAWPWRNLTALQALDSVWQGVTAQP
ncbi:MAG TPA: SGNH/GDSL hydrolase family protein [Anaerolineales bacterium]|nr:SGNH/GDSL hydrolase family protein [Anaerolineales bacterium]